jgi:putative transposase
VKELASKHGGVAAMCRLLDLAESSYYYEGDGRCDAKADLKGMQALVKLAGQHPTYGYRRLSKLLRRRKRFANVNAKRVRRIMKMAGISAKKKRRRIFTTDSTHGFRRYPNLLRDLSEINRPNKVWVCDITYIVLATGEPAKSCSWPS